VIFGVAKQALNSDIGIQSLLWSFKVGLWSRSDITNVRLKRLHESSISRALPENTHLEKYS
jgi:hypothetical protein